MHHKQPGDPSQRGTPSSRHTGEQRGVGGREDRERGRGRRRERTEREGGGEGRGTARRVDERYEGEEGMVSEGEGERRKRELGVKVRMG